MLFVDRHTYKNFKENDKHKIHGSVYFWQREEGWKQG